MGSDGVLFVIFCLALVCGIVGWFVGAPKKAEKPGMLLGFLLGPIGILIVAVAFDQREKCPACKTPINDGATICPACKTSLKMSDGGNPAKKQPATPKMPLSENELKALLGKFKNP